MIGLFGGTFDPIHFGHLRVGLDVQQALGLEELRFLPLNVAVHREQPAAGGALRREMVRVAIAGQPGFRLDDRELSRSGHSYTVDTLASLREELGREMPLCLLVGGDAFNSFLDWHRPRDILSMAHLVVMQRPGAQTHHRDPALRDEVQARRCGHMAELELAPAGRIWFQDVTQLEISSTRIRRMLAAGRSPRFLLPDAVLDLARREDCYAGRQCADSADSDGRPPAASAAAPGHTNTGDTDA
ncbi:MAG: nicotinate-nucleotide adenylyltransferase [Thiohalocapsa sp.]|nr:nicotinate-nucleotide adenylyltransferase [Thiohalocapsa sp.]MCF7991119.1 nicotinate-nucleotide adenylyltransferase [Thiohalocapsa sp.]